MTITSNTDGAYGYWRKTFDVSGGAFYRFSALHKTDNVATPRRSVLAQIVWRDDRMRIVPTDMGSVEPELPVERGVRANGWSELTDIYKAPPGATRAQVDLVLRWVSSGSVTWRDISLARTDPPPKHLVRLAAAHLRPANTSGTSENLRLMEPLVAEAADKKADLIVFGEVMTIMGVRKPEPAAETVPGPTTALLGAMARKHNIYLVAGLPEREGNLIYNSAVLLGPDGQLIGKYRKAALTTREAADGYTPGTEYPVFQTRFGKLGIMICYDLFFPEVARHLTENGAEIIAVPIWGGDELLARARAIDNRVFLVTSTYEAPWLHWMRSGVWDREGNLIAAAKRYGTIAVADVDLNERFDHKWLGDFRSQLPRERPLP